MRVKFVLKEWRALTDGRLKDVDRCAVFASPLNPSARADVWMMGQDSVCSGTSLLNFKVTSKSDAKATVLQRNALIAKRRFGPQARTAGRPWLVIFKALPFE